jgi:hypothetical protein
LIIAYRELRAVELEVLKRLNRAESSVREGQLSADVGLLSHVDVDQFFGIEHEEFPARIAEVAMYLVDHLANLDLSRELGLSYARIPLHTPANIHIGNALTVDWNAVLPASRCSFVFGNPPFVAKQRRTADQVADMAPLLGGRSVLDYVAAWFVKGADYARGTDIRLGFVATNSIVQGEQVPALWPRLISDGYEIDFAHRSFLWSSEARGRAAVYVVIVGFSQGGQRSVKLLFDYEMARIDEPQERIVSEISPYLTDAPALAIPVASRTPLSSAPEMRFGNMPNDGGHLLLSDQDREEIREHDPVANRYVREMIGAKALLNGDRRWCLWLEGADPADIRLSPTLRDRVARVRRYRLESKRAATRELAVTPSLFGEVRQPTRTFICVPRHTSERRRFIPMIFAEPTMVAHDSTLTIQTDDLYVFGVLHSSFWMAWVRSIGGRLKGDFRISAGLVYNTYPWPENPSSQSRSGVRDAARAVLEARSAHDRSSLKDLYDPLAMPADLVTAHRGLDNVVDRLYGRGRFDDATRLSVLLGRYARSIGLIS